MMETGVEFQVDNAIKNFSSLRNVISRIVQVIVF